METHFGNSKNKKTLVIFSKKYINLLKNTWTLKVGSETWNYLNFLRMTFRKPKKNFFGILLKIYDLQCTCI